VISGYTAPRDPPMTAVEAVALFVPLLLTLLWGCAPASPRATPPRTQPAAAIVDAGAEPIAKGEDVPSLDALAARGASDAPLMREVLRVEAAATTRSSELKATTDACYRAVVAASVPVRAWFEDDAHATRGEIASSTSVLVPPRGPACARKGETLRLVVDPTTPKAIARAVVWQSP
jgi:hypothetical protein